MKGGLDLDRHGARPNEGEGRPDPYRGGRGTGNRAGPLEGKGDDLDLQRRKVFEGNVSLRPL